MSGDVLCRARIMHRCKIDDDANCMIGCQMDTYLRSSSWNLEFLIPIAEQPSARFSEPRPVALRIPLMILYHLQFNF